MKKRKFCCYLLAHTFIVFLNQNHDFRFKSAPSCGKIQRESEREVNLGI